MKKWVKKIEKSAAVPRFDRFFDRIGVKLGENTYKRTEEDAKDAKNAKAEI